ncbi:hypothetical protein [Rhodococcus koreensis]
MNEIPRIASGTTRSRRRAANPGDQDAGLERTSFVVRQQLDPFALSQILSLTSEIGLPCASTSTLVSLA